MLGGHKGLFYSVHAADAGAIGIVAAVRVAGPDTLQPGDLLGLAVIRGLDQVPLKRATGRQHTFILQAGDHVGDLAVAVVIHARGIERLISRCQNEGTHIDRDNFFLVVKFNGAGGAELFAGPAFTSGQINALVRVDNVFQRNGLTVLDIGGFAFGNAHIEFVIDFFGAFLSAQPAGNALVHVDIAGFLANGNREVAFVSIDIDNF